jgi:serine/threonine protein phosphatase PrpC
MSHEHPLTSQIEPTVTVPQEAGVFDALGRADDQHGEPVSPEQHQAIVDNAEVILGGLNSEGVRHPGEVAREEAEAARQAARGEVMDRFNTAEKRGQVPEHAAGPDYRKATGLNHEQVQQLGFKSFSELATSARQRRAEQEEAARIRSEASASRRARLEDLLGKQRERNDAAARQRRAEQEEAARIRSEASASRRARLEDLLGKQRERNERKATTAQNAIEWRKEADKLRDARSPHTAVLREKLERATYKERLEMGGELGIRRTQEAAKAADDKHRASETRHVHVAEPSEAVKESHAATVAALRDFQKANNVAARNASKTQEAASDSTVEKKPQIDPSIPMTEVVDIIFGPSKAKHDSPEVQDSVENKPQIDPGIPITEVIDVISGTPETKDDSAKTQYSVVSPVDGQIDPTRVSGVDGDTFHAPASHEALSKFGIRSAVAEKPAPGHGEDVHIVDDELGVYGVLDGMGGHENARITAETARDAIYDSIKVEVEQHGEFATVIAASDALTRAFGFARFAISAAGLGEGSTTAAVAIPVKTAEGTYLVYRSAGDSLIKIYRDGEVLDVNQDQSLPDQGDKLTHYMGEATVGSYDDYGTYLLKEGDKIFIGSDGITGDWKGQTIVKRNRITGVYEEVQMPDQRITDAEWADAFGQPDPQASANRLVEISHKDYDDRTAVVLDYVRENKVDPQDAAQYPWNDDSDQLFQGVSRPVNIPAPLPGPQEKRFDQVRTFLANVGRRTNDGFVDALSWLSRHRRVTYAVGALATVSVGVAVWNSLRQGDSATVAGLTYEPKIGAGSGELAATAAQKAAEKAQLLQELGTVNVPKGGTYTATLVSGPQRMGFLSVNLSIQTCTTMSRRYSQMVTSSLNHVSHTS